MINLYFKLNIIKIFKIYFETDLKTRLIQFYQF